MRTEVVTAVIAILVLASLGIGYLTGSSARITETGTLTSTSVSTSTLTIQRTVTSTITSTSAQTAISIPGAAATVTDSNASTGLDLVLAVNATTLELGQSLNVSVSLFNTFPKVSSVPISDDWPFQGVPLAIFPDCDTMLLGSLSIGYNVSDAAEAVVVEGDYTIANITS